MEHPIGQRDLLRNEQKDKVNMLFKDMYIGDGAKNLSITTRLTMTEDRIDRMSKNINKALWLAVSTLIGLGIELAIKLLHI
jgi:hypothetical protein